VTVERTLGQLSAESVVRC